MIKLGLFKIFFAQKVTFLDVIYPKIFYQFQGSFKYKFFYKRLKFYTLLIDLTLNIEEIKKRFKSNTRNEINKSLRENNKWEIVINKEEFLKFYNNFAIQKNLPLISKKKLSYLFITKVMSSKDDVLCMHAYLVDNDIKRVRLLYSCTLLDNTIYSRSFIGRANRLCHYKDIEYFKKAGFLIYDFGGISNSGDPLLKGIDNFKKSFGGYEVEEYHYIHIILNILKKFLKK